MANDSTTPIQCRRCARLILQPVFGTNYQRMDAFVCCEYIFTDEVIQEANSCNCRRFVYGEANK